jgi:hypothetical protein
VDSDEDGVDDVCDDEYVKHESVVGEEQAKEQEAIRVIETIVALASQSITSTTGRNGSDEVDGVEGITEERVLSQVTSTPSAFASTDSVVGQIEEKHAESSGWPIAIGALMIVLPAILLGARLLIKKLS